MQEKRAKSFIVEGVTAKDMPPRLRNFKGEERKHPKTGKIVNAKGDRNFCLFLENELAEELKMDGWNVKQLDPTEEGEAPRQYLPIKVAFGKVPPKIVVMNGRGGSHQLSEDEVADIDGFVIETADIKINPYHWTVEGKSGIKAYLQTLYITIEEDELDRKYNNVPVSASYMPDDEEIPFT